MEPRTISLCLSALALALAGVIYGIKFIRKGNYLLGVEWLILATSSTNVMIYFMNSGEIHLLIGHFFDAFSRAFGLPIVAVAGLMTLTHGYRPSKLADALYFAGSFAATFVMLTWTAFAPILPYFYVVMWFAYTAYLIYFMARLVAVNEKGHALALAIPTALSLVIALIYDFWKIPGEETNVFLNFFTLALLIWAYATVQLYYAYCALERRLSAAK